MRSSNREKIRYRIDTFLAGGTSPLLVVLAASFLAALFSIAVFRLLLGVFTDDGISLGRHVWIVFLQMTDPGNMNQDNDTAHLFRFGTVPAGFVGVVIFSSLIAVLTSVLNEAIGRFRKGHSRVMESDHTVIVGWGSRVPEILRELAIANESRSSAAVAVLADADKEWMDEQLRVAFVDRKTTRVITRQGATSSIASLEQVNASDARSIVVLAHATHASPAEAKLASDAQVIKTVLALDVILKRSSTPLVVELFDPHNRRVVEDLSSRPIVAVDSADMLSRIIVQTSRTSGLAWVYSELLSFEGAELYLHPVQSEGAKFGDMLHRMKDAVPIGIVREDGTVRIRPDADTLIAPGTSLVVVAHDDSRIGVLEHARKLPEVAQPPRAQSQRRAERMLMLGWSPSAPVILREYAQYVPAGSAVDVVLHEPGQELRGEIEKLGASISGLTVRLLERNVLMRSELVALSPTSYDTVVVLRQKPSADLPAERIDAESIMVLLHLRSLAREQQGARTVETRIITEVLESGNQDLMSHAGANDFIVSDRLVSMIVAQLAEEPRLKLVFDELFRESGSEIYVKPADWYFADLPARTSFDGLLAVAQKRGGEICIGWRRGAKAEDASAGFGILLNPERDQEIELCAGDSLIVVAESDQ